MARIISNRRENPSQYVSEKLGIIREQLGEAIHEIKAAGDLSPAYRVIIYDMMTVPSRISAAMFSATSTTKSENRSRAFATLRFAGDALDPDEISPVMKQSLTRAYRKGKGIAPVRMVPRSSGKPASGTSAHGAKFRAET